MFIIVVIVMAGSQMDQDENTFPLHLIVTPWADAYGDDGSIFEREMNWSLLFQSGRDFYDTIGILRDAYKKDSLAYKPCVAIPLMHQCIELLAKGLLSKLDESANTRSFSHRTVDLLKAHRSTIAAFDQILSRPEDEKFLEQLESGYLKLKYGEAHCQFNFEEFEKFDSIVADITAEMRKISGLRW
jgi:hypothetical protein